MSIEVKAGKIRHFWAAQVLIADNPVIIDIGSNQ